MRDLASSLVFDITVASYPIPAITVNSVSSPSGDVRNRAASITRSCPHRATRMAHSNRLSGIDRFLASRFPVPIGMIPMGTSVSANASAIARTVPSPPAAITTSAPFSRASCAMDVPGSSFVVSMNSGSSHPSLRHTVVATDFNVSISFFVGL